MFAVIATGGKQYRVQKGSVLRIEKLTAEAVTAGSDTVTTKVADPDTLALSVIVTVTV